MQLQSYLFFDGRCEEAIEFYRKTLGAEVTTLMRFKDSPQPAINSPGSGEKVMHASMRIGDATVMASDGRCLGQPTFQGFALSLTVPNEAEARTTVWGARRRRPDPDAFDEDVLLAAFRHARRPLRRFLELFLVAHRAGAALCRACKQQEIYRGRPAIALNTEKRPE